VERFMPKSKKDRTLKRNILHKLYNAESLERKPRKSRTRTYRTRKPKESEYIAIGRSIVSTGISAYKGYKANRETKKQSLLDKQQKEYEQKGYFTKPSGAEAHRSPYARNTTTEENKEYEK